MPTGLLNDWVASIEQQRSLFEGISSSLGSPGPVERVARAEQTLFHFLVERMPATVETLAALWKSVLDDLGTGARPKDQLAEAVYLMSRATRAVATLAGFAESLWEAYPVLQTSADDLLAILSGVRTRLGALESQAARLAERLHRTSVPLDGGRVAAGVEDAKAGRTVRARDYLAELRGRTGADGGTRRV